MAWKLLFPDGTVFRDGFKDQWDALKTAFDSAGNHYKKATALEVKPGTVVYREFFVKVKSNVEEFNEDGSIKNIRTKTVSIPKMQKYVLVDDDFTPSAVLQGWFVRNAMQNNEVC